MDKSTRVLNIFTRLLNGETVRKSDLSDFGNVSTKSIQRDVRTINDFFYESEHWNNRNTEIVYKKNGYELITSFNSLSGLALLGLMVKIKSLTPILHVDVYNLFRREIQNLRIEDRKVLSEMLNHFKKRDESFPGEILMLIEKAISQKSLVWMKIKGRNIEVKPLSTMYMHYDYWFTYEYEKTVYTERVRHIENFKVSNHTFDEVKSKELVTVEIDKSKWELFRQQYTIVEILENTNDGKIIVKVACTELDAYYIAYQMAPLARILGPQKYIDSFIERINQIKSCYE
ncbi:hypothetical protein CD149_00475 [Staphylococcus condimenti]|uniref:WYL domain-containing protein n=2 Tax=Staphylococcus condimenti TaxID=70255 RepID=A0AB37H505_9STAP|nr:MULTISPECIES: hypothetical protein [Staphylococcus]AMY05928.1 hypothetical protein A4G25_08310 [Staphylococcus condimenti]APR59791.1 hypothetical protein BTZ13_00590 [Staphylococcus condimenti]MDK8644917.1 hypothetical protein [Staphylococcus condimenti]OFP03037.1 hypothetical protein HMPREF3007_08450 [Staphylococcus sp. HMSC065E08]PNZ64122.1 hypothetical protein CD149_00475 [Staphylococcus condimenti]